MKKLILLLIIVNLISLFSCKKDEDMSQTQLLCNGPWILSASVINPAFFFEDIGAITDYYAILPTCLRDDLWIFYENGDYSLEEGATKCDPGDPKIFDRGTWASSLDFTTISLTSAIYFSTTEYDILELTEQTLKIERIIYDTLNNSYTYTQTFNHQ
ncbi:MAG: hypothetical protein JSV22_02900 [Bacteroidales bacterium]|nr:MAG: hypothetical protein JSV22_02900 [Bacteroidales bacterium]